MPKPKHVSMDHFLLTDPETVPSRRPWLDLYTEKFIGEWNQVPLTNFATPKMVENGSFMFPYQEVYTSSPLMPDPVKHVKFLSLTRDKSGTFYRLTARKWRICNKTTRWETKGDIYRDDSYLCVFNRYASKEIGFSKIQQLLWKARKQKKIYRVVYRPISKRTLTAIKNFFGKGIKIL
jgi:hypothetical protein